jgi:hypothetical protein
MRKRAKLKLKNRYGSNEVYATDNWHKSEYEEDPDNAPKTFRQPPNRYEEHFLAKLDGRSRAAQILRQSFDEITSDLGGVEGLSHVQLCLVERFCFLEFMLRKKELEMAVSNKNGERDKSMGSWVQSLNSLVGLAKAIGLERRAKHIESLQTYIRQKKKNNK